MDRESSNEMQCALEMLHDPHVQMIAILVAFFEAAHAFHGELVLTLPYLVPSSLSPQFLSLMLGHRGRWNRRGIWPGLHACSVKKKVAEKDYKILQSNCG